MRPGDFSPGNAGPFYLDNKETTDASMRPGDFSPGNLRRPLVGYLDLRASMRPGDFSPGNSVDYMRDMARRAISLQ